MISPALAIATGLLPAAAAAAAGWLPDIYCDENTQECYATPQRGDTKCLVPPTPCDTAPVPPRLTTTILAKGQATPRGIATNGGDIYWVNWDGGIAARVPVARGAVETLATRWQFPMQIAVDGGFAM